MPSEVSSHPDLDWYRKAAKKKLRALQALNPKSKLAEAQLAVARKHGFASWRQLKTRIESTPGPADSAVFIQAVKARDSAAVSRLLKSSPALANVRDEHGASALHVAVMNNEPGVVRTLLNAVRTLEAFFDADGRAIIGSSTTGSSRYAGFAMIQDQ